MKEKLDYIIIGQGIAGTTLAWWLNFNKKQFYILNDEKKNTSSTAALGIYNPITGRNSVKTWNAEILFKELEKFYSKVEKKIKKKILYKKNIYRPYKNIKEANLWNEKISNSKYENYIKSEVNNKKINGLYDELGGVITSKSGYIDVNKYILESKKYFISLGRYKKYKLNNKKILIENNKIKIKNWKTNNIIMCIGIDETKNKLFSYLPFKHVTGSSMIIKTKLKIKNIINKGISIIPLKNDLKNVGSTYGNETNNNGLQELIDKLSKLLKIKYTIIKEKFGVRPGTIDRRPFVGKHPIFDNLYILNGLGSKGISLAPFCSKELFNSIEQKSKINFEINVKRYNSKNINK